MLYLAPNVPVLPVTTTLDTQVERLLEGAKVADLSSCFIIGRYKTGEAYFASTISDGGTIMWEMEITKMRLLQLMS